MTNNNKENDNKNLFIKIVKWCKRKLFVPYLMLLFVTVLIVVLIVGINFKDKKNLAIAQTKTENFEQIKASDNKFNMKKEENKDITKINANNMKLSTSEQCKEKGLHYIGKMIEPRVNHLSYVLNKNKIILIGGYLLLSFPPESNSEKSVITNSILHLTSSYSESNSEEPVIAKSIRLSTSFPSESNIGSSFYKKIHSIEIINTDNLKEHYSINVDNLCNINSVFKINENRVFLAGKNLYLLDLQKKECILLDENINILKIFSLKNDLIYYVTTNLNQINSYNIKTKERMNVVFNIINQNNYNYIPNFEVIESEQNSKYIFYPSYCTSENLPVVIIDKKDFSYNKINITYKYDRQKAFIYDKQNIVCLNCKAVENNTDVEVRLFNIKNNIFSLKKKYKLEGISLENISFIQLNDGNIVFVENYKISKILDIKSFELKNVSQIYEFNYLSNFINLSNNKLFITGGIKDILSVPDSISNDIWAFLY